jgi:general secretion pathway protein H
VYIRKTYTGFSLIEILVVLFIIGITLSFALLSFGDFGEKRRIIVAAEQFTNYIRFIQHQAILENNLYRILIQPNSYQAQQFHPPEQWSFINSRLFLKQILPKGMHIRLVGDDKKTHQIIIDASGTTKAFQLQFGSIQTPFLGTIVHDSKGQITVHTAENR